MEGNPTNLTVYIDTSVVHDHTYIGNGCPNTWGTDGDGGSKTPCNTRIVQSKDGEGQINGSYYSFRAVTSGSGGLSEDNKNTPDTFCPLGWQLPYSGTGGDYYDKSKSWNYLFTTYNITFDDGTEADRNKVSAYPFSYIYSGTYHWNTGLLYYQGSNGSYWAATVYNSTSSYRLRTGGATRPTALDNKTVGYTLRCVTRKRHPRKAFHGIRVRL